jgi:hypothetical protein
MTHNIFVAQMKAVHAGQFLFVYSDVVVAVNPELSSLQVPRFTLLSLP